MRDYVQSKNVCLDVRDLPSEALSVLKTAYSIEQVIALGLSFLHLVFEALNDIWPSVPLLKL